MRITKFRVNVMFAMICLLILGICAAGLSWYGVGQEWTGNAIMAIIGALSGVAATLSDDKVDNKPPSGDIPNAACNCPKG